MSAPARETSGLALSTGGIEVARQIISSLAEQHSDLELIENYVLRKAANRAADLADQKFGTEYVNFAERLWKTEGRQVLSMHPGLANEVRLAKSTKIAPEVFRTLPYINPMVVFPSPVEVPSWNDQPETIRVLGFLVHGRSNRPEGVSSYAQIGEILGSTHDTRFDRLGMVIITEVIDTSGNRKTYEFNRTSISLVDQPRTLADMVESAIGGYGWANRLGRDIVAQLDENGQIAEARFSSADRSFLEDRQRVFMQKTFSLVLGSLMYLCSTVLDAQTVPKSRIRRAWGQTRQVPNLINVGWRIGPALSTARAAYRDKEGSALPGRSLPPHQRCAHFKTVWTGPGRTIPKTAFVAPYWVHKEQMHLVDTKTVRPVK